ncbi:tellurite resistance protein, partial [Escherichia coli O111:H8]
MLFSVARSRPAVGTPTQGNGPIFGFFVKK